MTILYIKAIYAGDNFERAFRAVFYDDGICAVFLARDETATMAAFFVSRENLRGSVAAGIFKRVIFVPRSWSEWPEENRRVVLEHKLAHHRRRDPLWRLFVELACAVHWYHPLVRWMARRFIMQCEFACDAIVLRKGIDAKVYARVLCDFAEDRSLSPLAFSLAESPASESRVCRMLAPAGSFSGKAMLARGGLGLLAACSLAMVGRENVRVPSAEVQLRLTAEPFPGEE